MSLTSTKAFDLQLPARHLSVGRMTRHLWLEGEGMDGRDILLEQQLRHFGSSSQCQTRPGFGSQ